METPYQNTVLLIDPNYAERQSWKERLANFSSHYRIVEAEDAERGLAINKSERIDCVVTELHLPDMSGFQFLMRLNPIVHRTLHTPVVALSHFILPSITDAARKLGAQSYLLKSEASDDDLDRAIQEAIATVKPIRKDVQVSDPPKMVS